MLSVREIEPELLYDIRHSNLRPHQPYEACIYDTDRDEDAFHVGAYFNETLVSIASFYLEKSPNFSNKVQYRLRAMATIPEQRKLGAGRAVVKYAESRIKKQNADILWCMGRTNVQGYYEKLGFQAYGDVFDYPPIGPHIIMYKILKGKD